MGVIVCGLGGSHTTTPESGLNQPWERWEWKCREDSGALSMRVPNAQEAAKMASVEPTLEVSSVSPMSLLEAHDVTD